MMSKSFCSVVILAIATAALCQDKAPEKPAPPQPRPFSLRELSLTLEQLSNRVRSSVVQIFSNGFAPA
ncbi:MAG: hypothetical protein M3Y27_04085, partial [Acidobacteriota bacterium]|nr:hypothetical protein [Acidobacteriota bacterium]